MTVQERIASLRNLMKEKHIDAYLVPSADNHQSEYVGEHFKSREFITGFTGSAGDAVITMDDAGLWTDARYFLQAEAQLAGSGVRLFKMGEPDVQTLDEYLEDVLPDNGTLGFDGRVVAMQDGKALDEEFSGRGIKILYSEDLIDQIWNDRPALSEKPAFLLEEKYTGESTASKLERIRGVMKENGANIHVLTTLDDICWMINLRGDDIDYSPMILSYAIIRPDSVDLFIDERKLNDECRAMLAANNILLHPYNDIYEEVKNFTSADTILIDPKKVNYAIYNNIPQDAAKVELPNPSTLFKSVKNDVELKNIINAHIKDGVAFTKFMHWMKTNVGKEKITEMDAADKLDSFRQAEGGYLWQSFEPIIAYGTHAAIVHYSATPETDIEIQPKGLLLTDTGGNYYEGTTDISRTFVLGDITEEEKLHFTTVARSNLNLSAAKFLYGCSGYNLDILARKPMWDLNLDFKHGTGHGVGYLLSVHEGPAGFRWQQLSNRNESHRIEAGMVITDEPGIYIADSHGVRTENELVVRRGVANEFGQFMYFEPITYAPIDLEGIDPDAMAKEEKDLLNEYHKTVYDTISPYFSEEDKVWLREYTREI